jgi:galactitol-specific phosphotransferase system IIB component
MELEQDNLIDDLTKPPVFLSKINTLKEKLPSILDDFKKYYIFYNKNPEYTEYQQMFENIKSNLQSINSDLFMTSNNIEKDTESINDRLQKINILIRKEKMKNQQLKKRLGIVEKKYNGSDELISDYKEIYNLDYLNNFALLFGVILLGVTLVSKFKGQVATKV